MKLLLRVFYWFLGLGFAGALIGAAVLAYMYQELEPDLPDVAGIREVKFQEPLRVYSRDDKLIAEFGKERRIPVTYSELPRDLVHAFLAAEDDRFFEHPGVDWMGITRAVYVLATTGNKSQGGSTITMQLARNFYLSKEKSYRRKMQEIIVALKIERMISKQEILALYLNKIFLGNRAYGVAAAARIYYQRELNELSLPQIAMLATLPKAPSKYNPIVNPQRALNRRSYVLRRMRELGYITESQYHDAISAPVTAALHATPIDLEAGYVAEMARRYMTDTYGEQAYTGGYRVQTTVDSRLQVAARTALRTALNQYDQRHGYRGPEGYVELPASPEPYLMDEALADKRTIAGLVPGIVVDVEPKSIQVYIGEGRRVAIGWDGLSWARKYINESRRGRKLRSTKGVVKIGDIVRVKSDVDSDTGSNAWRLAQMPAAQGALVSLDPDTGAAHAVMGGYDYFESKFNRALQAERQPGSNFKPFLYSAALETEFTPATLINDAPVVFDAPGIKDDWKPTNASLKFYGPTRFREALVKSRNLVSIRLLRAVGIDYTVDYAKRFGFREHTMPKDLSLSLGTMSTTPWELAGAYATFANGGYRVRPYFIQRIETGSGELVYEAPTLQRCEDCAETQLQEQLNAIQQQATPQSDNVQYSERIITPQNWYLMNSILREVVQRGTATLARKKLGRKDLAGKTGTTNDQMDAWFSGFTKDYVTVCWVGFDKLKPLGRGEYGGVAALPMWNEFMKVALDGVEENKLKLPSGMVRVRINRKNGLVARRGSGNAMIEYLRAGNISKVQAQNEVYADPYSSDEQGAMQDLY